MEQRPLTKTEIVALLKAEGLWPNRRRGQNFLIDGNLLRIVAEAPGLSGDDVVLEVGAGLGQLTRLLASAAGHVVGVEIDAGFVRVLGDLLGDLDNVEIIQADVLDRRRSINPAVLEAVERSLAARPGSRWRVVSNPAYSIATPFILTCLTPSPLRGEGRVRGSPSHTADLRPSPQPSPWKGEGVAPADLHLTLQEEVAERLASAPGGKTYGAATVLIQAVARVSLLRRVPATAFWPRPAVDSTLVRIVPEPEQGRRIRDFEAFRRVVARLFQARRKTLRNALRNLLETDQADRLLAETGLAGERRPEALAVEEFIALANVLVAP